MHDPLPEKDMFIIEKQNVVLQDFECSGYILDIGGGGEGVIGLLKGESVIALDSRKSELEEAPDGPLKVVMDARDLQFLDNTFETVTAFFTLMYILKADRKRIFEEMYRVVKPGGSVLIWDVVIPLKGDTREWFVIPVVITVHGKTIETGYGVRWEGREQDMLSFIALAEKTGFEVVEKTQTGQTFFLHLKK
jgi:ubiquinone/menaquinone biosynthesis C-methylase UbiE